MSRNEMELIHLIREHDNSSQALMTATYIIAFLKQHESSEEPSVVDLRVHF